MKPYTDEIGLRFESIIGCYNPEKRSQGFSYKTMRILTY